MKATLYFIILVLSLGGLYAQEVNCVEKQSEFSKFVNNGKYKEANELLPLLRKKCASQNEELYLLGIKSLKYTVDLASADTKEIAIRDLMKFYDQYDASFPNNKNGNMVNKAMLLHDNNKGTDAEIYSILNKAFTTNPDQFTNANALFVYFKMYNDNYKNKTENISLEQVLQKYSEVLTVIEKNRVAFPDKAVEFNNAAMASKSLIRGVVAPDSLIAMAESKFEANMQNTDWLESTANLLAEKSATSVIFGKIAKQLHQLKPTSKSAYHLANYNLKNRDMKQAVVYFEQSASLASNPSDKAQTYYTAATILSTSDKEQAKKLLAAAMENDPKNGSYYIFLADMYANAAAECGTSEIQKKAIYQLATITAQKAAQAEPRLKPTAILLEKEYSKNSPSKAELEAINKAGGKVIIGCWIKETVSF